MLGIFNLFPIIPLDGGNILISVLEPKFQTRKSLEISIIVGKVILIVLSMMYAIFILVLKNLWILITLIYLWYLFLREERALKKYLAIYIKLDFVQSHSIY